MAFVVEDGTGLVDSNSFADVSEYRDYFLDRGISTVSDTDASIQSWLVIATSYIEKRFGLRFQGTRVKTGTGVDSQSLSFPRLCVAVDGVDLPSDVLPKQLVQATYEYAIRVKSLASLAPDPPVPFDRTTTSGTTISGSGIVTERREVVGPIEEEVHFGSTRDVTGISKESMTVPGIFIPSYPEADMLIEPLLRSTSGGRAIRA